MNRALLALLILVVIAVDQWTKALARTHLSPFPRTYAGGILSLLHTENEGAFLSLGSTLPHATRTLIFTGAVAIAGSIQYIPPSPPPALIRAVTQTAERISRKLGWNGRWPRTSNGS